MLSALPEMPVYSRLPLTLVAGHGSYVYDDRGTAYLDLYGGHAVAATGHCHPEVVAAIQNQAAELIFYSNAVDLPVRRACTHLLVDLAPAPLKAAFLCNSGVEANEHALTVARLVTGRAGVTSFEGGFHGRSALTLGACGIANYRKLAPPIPDLRVVPFGDLDAAGAAIDEHTAAVIVEPVQGLGGCRVASPEFLAGLRDLCRARGALLVFDEVQCGTGRSGAFTAAQAFGVTPDLLTLAKGLGGGVPIGAVLIDLALVPQIPPGKLGTTFGGGPLACAAALANLTVIDRDDLCAHARQLGESLRARIARLPGVREARGAGLLIGIVLDRPAAPVRDRLLTEKHQIVGTATPPDVLRIMPPLNLTTGEADLFVDALHDILNEGVS